MSNWIINQIVARIRSYNLDTFGAFIHQVVSPDVELNARGDFTIYQTNDPNSLFRKLILLLEVPSLQTRLVASMAFRDHLAKSLNTWNQLTTATQVLVEEKLLNSVLQQQDETLIHSVCETSAILASNTGSSTGISIITRWVTMTDFTNQEMGYRVFALLQPPLSELTLASIRSLESTFLKCLISPGPIKVQTAAVRALIKYLPHLLDLDGFTDQIPLIMNFVINAVVDGHEAIARRTLGLLTTLAETQPLCFMRHNVMQGVVRSSIMIGKSPAPRELTRSLSFAFVTTLIKAAVQMAPEMLPTLLPHIEKLFEICFDMLEDVTDDPIWHFEGVPDEPIQTIAIIDNPFWTYVDESHTFHLGKHTLSCLAFALTQDALEAQHFDPLVEYTLGLLRTYMTSDSWQQRHAGILAIAILADEFLAQSFQHTRDLMLHGFADEHVRVRWATISYSMKLYTLSNDNFKEVVRRNCSIWLLNLARDSNTKVKVRARKACSLFGLEVDLGADIIPVSVAGI